MTSSVTNPGKGFARIALALVLAAMGIYAGAQTRRAGPSSDSCSCSLVVFGVRTARTRLDLGRAHRSGGRRAHCRVRGISHPFEHHSSGALRASSGRAVGQRAGTLVTIGGSRRSRVVDGARGHRRAEPARSLDRGRHRRRRREVLSGPKGSDGGMLSPRRPSHPKLDSTSALRHRP